MFKYIDKSIFIINKSKRFVNNKVNRERYCPINFFNNTRIINYFIYD